MCIFKSIMHWTNNHPSISTPLYKPPDCRRPQTTCIQASVSPTLCSDECSLYSHYGKKAWKLLKLKLAEIAQIFGVIWNKMALDPSERWIYGVISVSCTQLSLPNMPFFSPLLLSFSPFPFILSLSILAFLSSPCLFLPLSLNVFSPAVFLNVSPSVGVQDGKSEMLEWNQPRSCSVCVCVRVWVRAHAWASRAVKVRLIHWLELRGVERSAGFNSDQFGPLPLTNAVGLAKCLRQTARLESSARFLS